MTSYTWKGVSGDWNLASDWTPAGGPPKSTSSATIDGSATDTITVDTADVANSLTLSDANSTLNDDGPSASLTISGTLTMSNGTLDLSPDFDGGVLTVGALNLSGGALVINSGGQLDLNGTLSQTGGTLTLQGGTISGGTIKSTAGTLTLSGGTLSGVTYDGTLDLSGANTNVDIANGTVVNNAAGTGAGTINDTGQSSFLFFDNTQTLNNATINLGNATGYSSFLYNSDTTGAGTVLTLGSTVTVDESGYAQIRDSGSAGDGIVNQGTISQTASGADLQNYGNSFTNGGTITAASSGGSLAIDTTTFTNNGAIDISNGETVTIEPTNFSNASKGVISVGEFDAESVAGRVMEQSGLDHARQRFFALSGRQLHARRLGNADQLGRHGLHCRNARQRGEHAQWFERPRSGGARRRHGRGRHGDARGPGHFDFGRHAERGDCRPAAQPDGE